MIRKLLARYQTRNISILSKVWAGSAGTPKFTEEHLTKTLKDRFPNAKHIEVCDVSGGCGAMYEIIVESKDFSGLSVVKQHRLITDTLRSEIKDMHGIRIQTAIPKES